jgi:hypothetical protein
MPPAEISEKEESLKDFIIGLLVAAPFAACKAYADRNPHQTLWQDHRKFQNTEKFNQLRK